MTEAGKLDQRITFQARALDTDYAGGFVETWHDLPNAPKVWAQVTPRLGREAMDQGRMNATQMATFTVRQRADVSESCRIIWRDEAWNIRRVLRKSPRAQYLEIDAERGVAP